MPTAAPGPSSRLEPTDPTTLLMVISTIGAILTKLIPSLAGWHISAYYPATVTVVAGGIVIAGIVSKHGLSGKQRIADALTEVASVWKTAVPQLPTGVQTRITEAVDEYGPLLGDADSVAPSQVRLWVTQLEAWIKGGEKGPIPVFPPVAPVPPTPVPPAPPTPTPTPPVLHAPPVPSPTAAQTVVWYNQSPATITDAECQQIVAALNAQIPDIVALWGASKTDHHEFGTDPTTLPAGAWPAYFLPTSDTAGALAYHSTDPLGRPFSRVFVDTILANGGTMFGPGGVSVAASHEAVEQSVDPSCTLVATAPDGKVWCLEAADPNESDSYAPAGTNIYVSDFVGPAFFGITTPVPVNPNLDHMGIAAAPFTISPGGYAIIDNSAVYGESYPDWRKSLKADPAARTYRRVHPAAAVVIA